MSKRPNEPSARPRTDTADIDPGCGDQRAARQRPRVGRAVEHDQSDSDRPQQPHVRQRSDRLCVGECERARDGEVRRESGQSAEREQRPPLYRRCDPHQRHHEVHERGADDEGVEHRRGRLVDWV